jgi:hypothetical protein
LSAYTLQSVIASSEADVRESTLAVQVGRATDGGQSRVGDALAAAHLAQRDRVEAERVVEVVPGLVEGIAISAEQVAESTVAFRDLWVTVEEGQPRQEFADVYGLSGTQLQTMNPDVDLNVLDPGTQLLVYRYHPSLPSMSRGAAARGRLVNGRPPPRGEHWIVRHASRAWGTTETVSELVRGLTTTAVALPGGGRPMVADISRRRGGRFRPHRSHTSGRDVDVTYYRNDVVSTPLFSRTTRYTLDHARQWHLFKYWIERDLVTYIFIDNRLQRSLYDFAVEQGESAELLEEAFGRPRGRGILRYSPGHDDHFHVRFTCVDSDPGCRES